MEVNRQNTEVLTPHQPSERIKDLDVIRGFALFGILLINMSLFNSPLIYLTLTGNQLWTGTLDVVVFGIISFLVWGKFFALFTFLFGIGFTIFMERAEKKRKHPTFIFLRRLLVLLIIGLIHAFFIWSGDILLLYALVGFLLPLFFRCKPKTLLVWVGVLFSLPIILVVLTVGTAAMMGESYFSSMMQPIIAEWQQAIDTSLYVYAQGSFAEIMQQRTEDVLFMYSVSIYIIPFTLAMFLLGVYTGKKKILHNIQENLPFIKKVWLWSLIIGLIMSTVKVISFERMDPLFPTVYDLTYTIGSLIGDPALCFFYATSIVLLMRKREWVFRLSPLGNVGRMALSNYLFQSIVCTTLFYSYGFGLYGQVGPAVGVVITLAIFSIQLVLSSLWLKKYRYGPIEWIWRKLTYGRLA